MPEDLDSHYELVVRRFLDGRIVPFLGAGVNLCGRPEKTAWKQGQYLPSGGELAAHLAENFRYPLADKNDLLRVSQYVDIMLGAGTLYEELHKVFDAEYPPTPLHQFLATFPTKLREKGYPPRYQLIVTTNYDDVLEFAFKSVKPKPEPFDLVTYVTEGKRDQIGKFWHWPPDGPPRLIEKPNEYFDLPFEQRGKDVILNRTTILKIHGAIDRVNDAREKESFMITEDHYIDYLTHTDISNLLPVALASKLRSSHFLFLGYSLRDWNLRVILHRIWGEQTLNYQSWAILLDPSEYDKKFWGRHSVDILNLRLEDYVAGLNKHLQALPPAGGGP